ncbi:hypothetical protein NTG1052_660036 [Candidatus Nitrotoga sp. 1052]|nr:hypothetical protein NTG1052_660036 [Candidatus Nitrotoga sp. 1052]
MIKFDNYNKVPGNLTQSVIKYFKLNLNIILKYIKLRNGICFHKFCVMICKTLFDR